MNISVTFWLNGGEVFSTWTDSFPHYQKGEMIYLSSNVTPIGKEKFTSAENFRGRFLIEKITHSIERQYSDDISDLHRVEVQLKEE